MATKPFTVSETIRATRKALLADVGDTAFAIFRNLVFGSPVGDPKLWGRPPPPGYVGGTFRRNWQVSIGGFEDSIIDAQDDVGSVTAAEGKRVIDKWQAARKLNVNIVIQNNMPYANRLAQGWSRQAPAGWVDDDIDAALGFPGGTKVVP